jgi:CRISPR-associated protein Cmr5
MPRLSEHRRAREAHAVVSRWAADSKRQEYRQELQQLPSRILASGLGQTLAFYASKGGLHHEIGGEVARFVRTESRDLMAFLHWLMSTDDLASYRRLTREALAYAEWLKRYGAALIPKERKPAGEGAGRP